MNRLLLLMSLTFSVLCSQNQFNQNGERSGFWTGYHDNGNVKYIGNFVDGKEKGVFKYYDDGENLVIELNYVSPGLKSDAILYYPDGVIKSKGQYLNKKKHGLWTYYNREHQIIAKEHFLAGKLDGECIYFYKNGVISEKYNYLNNMKEGYSEIYYRSGDINMRCYYHLDTLHGFVDIYYDKINQLESQGKYNMGVKDSIWVFYSQFGDTLNLYDYRKTQFLTID